MKKYKDISSYGCGYAEGMAYLHIQELYAKCYLGLNDYQKADEILMPYLIEARLYQTPGIDSLAYNSLLKRYSLEDLKKLYEYSFSNYKAEKDESGKSNDYYIILLNTKIKLEFVFDQNNPNKEIDQTYRRSVLYHFLQNQFPNPLD